MAYQLDAFDMQRGCSIGGAEQAWSEAVSSLRENSHKCQALPQVKNL
jgi:hypothetical protein